MAAKPPTHSTSSTPDESHLRWYQGLDRYCWVILVIAALGWLFDTMDQNIFNLVRAPSLNDLLRPHYDDPELLRIAVSEKGGLITSIFLIGWAVGGFVFGILGDRLGRARTMILTILIYSIFTGLSGLSQNWETYAVMRFMTALGVGGEWAAGAALVAEVFPNRSRPMALGLLQALSAVGNMMASGITLALGDIDVRWRWAYFIGALPALLVIYIRRNVREPERWQEARAEAHSFGREMGSITELFTHPVLRRNTLAAVLLATAGVGALWGVGFFSTDLLRSELLPAGRSTAEVTRLVSYMFLLQNLGAFFGIYLFAGFSERTNRRTAFFLWFALAWASVLAFFWGVAGSGDAAFSRALILAPIMGFCTLGPFSGYTVYFPELFPTRLRTTGCGFCYNAARILAAAAPFALGKLAASMGGLAPAATVVTCIYILGFIGAYLGPETHGKPLPD
jgi:predicted MFS family arabinose efflux permease